jgi:small-conductance mechanosensitive channel
MTRHSTFRLTSTQTLVVWLTACVAILAATGCQPSSSPGGALGDTLRGRSASTPAPPADPAGSESSNSEEPSEESATEPKLKVRTLSMQSAEAKQALQKNFEGFLDREPIGFNAADVWDYAASIGTINELVVDTYDSLKALSAREAAELGLPFIIIALFFVAYAGVRRPVRRLSHSWQARIHADTSEWVTRAMRGLVMVGARCASVLILIGVSYIPVQAIFHQAIWADLLTELLWLLLVYRAATATSVVVFSGRVIDLDDDPARSLEKFSLLGIRLAVAYSASLLVISDIGISSEIHAFVQFLFRLLFLLVPIYALTIRDAFVTLLPEDIDSTLYQFYRDALIRQFRPLMGLAAFLVGFRAAGFERASTFVLARGAALLLVAGLAFVVGSKLRQFLRRRLSTVSEEVEEAGPLDTDRDKLIRRVEQLLGTGTIVAVTFAVLELTALFEPTVILLRTPFLAIGGARISFLHFINLGLIIFGAVLVTRLVRTILNTKIYPFLEVDVGVAYAINTITNYILVVVAFFIGLSALGVDLTAITVVLASLGVGIGFGLQTLVENLISGFIILFGRSVQKGDFITVNDTYGQVDAVGARSVVVKTPDNYELLIPSKDIVSAQVINWTYEDNTIRTRLPVGVSYREEPKEVRDVLLEVTNNHQMILEEPPPHVRLKGFGDSSVDFELFFYFDCRQWTENRVLGEVNFAVWDALKQAGIEIPFPQRDVHFKSLGNPDQFQQGFGSSADAKPDADSPPPEADPRGRGDEPTTDAQSDEVAQSSDGAGDQPSQTDDDTHPDEPDSEDDQVD